MTKFDPKISIFEKSSFWFIVGILIYLGATFFFNILGNSMGDELLDSYYHFSYLGDILKNIIFCVGIFLLTKEWELEPKKDNSNNIPNLDMI